MKQINSSYFAYYNPNIDGDVAVVPDDRDDDDQNQQYDYEDIVANCWHYLTL